MLSLLLHTGFPAGHVHLWFPPEN